MKITLYIDARIGREQQVRTSNGKVKVKAVYDGRWCNRVGYLQKGKRTWTAYSRDGEEIGVYTHCSVALTYIIINGYVTRLIRTSAPAHRVKQHGRSGRML